MLLSSKCVQYFNEFNTQLTTNWPQHSHGLPGILGLERNPASPKSQKNLNEPRIHHMDTLYSFKMCYDELWNVKTHIYQGLASKNSFHQNYTVGATFSNLEVLGYITVAEIDAKAIYTA